MLEILISLIGGAAAGFGLQEVIKIMQERGALKGLKMIKEARKKGKKIFICETKNAFWVSQEKESFQNLSITEDKSIIVVAPNSVKPVYGLGGVMLGVADLYRACTIPQELRQTIVFLKLIGLDDKDISEYLSIIHGKKTSIEGNTAEEKAENFLKQKIDELIKNSEGKKKEILQMIKEKPEIYLATPSTIVEFLQTGLNRVTFKMQVKQIIDEKLLEKIGRRDWLSIAIAVFIILIGIWFVLGGGLGNLVQSFMGAHAPVPLPR